MKVIIKPLEGIELDSKKIILGCSREIVESILGKPHIFESSYYYFKNEIRFDFDRDNKLEFIELLGGMDGVLQPEIYGINPFAESTDKVYEILAQHNNGDIDDRENGYSYAFVETDIGIYRPSIPEDVDIMAENCRQAGEPLSAEEYEYEYRHANYWSTIGIGGKGYYNYDEEKLFRVGDVKKLYNAFKALCDFVEEDIYCGKRPLWKDMCGADAFSEALERIRYTANIRK
ncbi:MAG: hypothetical protein K2J40_01955 [Ruminococcus sp.]|nr:hypothetical protein [Ruminococcus sp.]